MSCCHTDFALVEGSDRGFTIGMPTSTFGSGVLAEAGDNARELGLRRIALFTDRQLKSSPYVATVRASLEAAKVDVALYDSVDIEPTDASFQDAGALRGRWQIRRLRVGRWRLGDGHVQGRQSLCIAPRRVHDLCQRADRRRAEGAGRRAAAHRVSDHLRHGLRNHRIAIFNLRAINAKTGIISRRLIPTIALIDPDVTASLPKNAIAATGFDCMSHALESLTARAYPRRSNPARGIARPVSQGANPFSDMLAREALQSVGKFLVRAVNDATDTEARTEMMYAAMLAGIAFNAAGCHLPHGLSYAVSGLTRDWHVDGYPDGKDARSPWHGGGAQQSVRVALHRALRSGTPSARRPFPWRAHRGRHVRRCR
jgi:hypothetical protein